MRATRFFHCRIWICGTDKNAVAFEWWNKAGELLSKIFMWRARQQPTLSLPQLHFSGKSIPPTSYFHIRPTKTSHHLDFSWANTIVPGSFFFLCQFSVSCHQVQFTLKTPVASVVKPCTSALDERWEHKEARLNNTALSSGICLHLYTLQKPKTMRLRNNKSDQKGNKIFKWIQNIKMNIINTYWVLHYCNLQ